MQDTFHIRRVQNAIQFQQNAIIIFKYGQYWHEFSLVALVILFRWYHYSIGFFHFGWRSGVSIDFPQMVGEKKIH